MTERRWVSVSEASAYFGINRKTLYSLAARGLLPPGAVLKLGRTVRINISVIEGDGASTTFSKRNAGNIMPTFSMKAGVGNER